MTGPPPATPAAWSAALSAADPAAAPLVGRNSGKCIDVAAAAAAPVIVWACHGGPNQRFTLPAVGATGEVCMNGGALCVDVDGRAGGNGDGVIAWECHGGANQRWDATAGPADPPQMRQVASGCLHHCALAADGRAHCCSGNYQGQLGRGFASEAGVMLRPAPGAGGVRFASLALGAYHACGVTDAGEAYCWGATSDGRLGTGAATGAPVATPTAVAGGLRFASLAAEWSGTCGRGAGGEPYCWGYDEVLPYPCAQTTPRPVAAGAAYTQISVGYTGACALTGAGAVVCWRGLAGPAERVAFP